MAADSGSLLPSELYVLQERSVIVQEHQQIFHKLIFDTIEQLLQAHARVVLRDLPRPEPIYLASANDLRRHNRLRARLQLAARRDGRPFIVNESDRSSVFAHAPIPSEESVVEAVAALFAATPARPPLRAVMVPQQHPQQTVIWNAPAPFDPSEPNSPVCEVDSLGLSLMVCDISVSFAYSYCLLRRR